MIPGKFISPLLLFSPLLLAAGILPGQEPVIEEGGDDEEARQGVVTLSDGTVLRGGVSFTAGKRLRVYDLRHRRIHHLDLEQIEAIRTLVDLEKLEEAWAFEEEGKRKKIQLGWTYPLRQYRQEVQLTGGQVIEGHCYAAVLYVDDGEREHRVILPRVQRGKKGEELADLVYPRGVVFGSPGGKTVRAPPRSAPLASLRGRIAGLSAVTLIEIRSERGYPGAVAGGGAFRVEGLLPGKYAAFLRRGDEVVAGFPPAAKSSPEEERSMEKRIASLAEFFDDRRIVLRGGESDRPWLLLELRRRGRTTLPSGSGTARVLRWELWSLRRDGASWRIASRVFLDRQLIPAGKNFPAPRYRRDPRLWGIDLKAGENALPR